MAERKFKVTDHVLVPEHVKLSDEEAYEILKKYGLKPEDLPILRVDDPVAKELGLKPGDIVKIIRRSDKAEEVVTLRYVVGI
ncbi:DNA-directed RNA polymerase subunit H [Ignicoccus islandicus DSM 13165]|uniref:DNA-directed RNA polymerase subunit Rpo5 n=1 Tax=Ignicoccus islandicus DSM 13165 TaxID=940295 RepID=A0A0U3E230_9CREN|nr:DNA-directed RNA polymerase subunit H [Ignicoccus islandicus]ALU11979.1 DNA-directed RNA polymerase subunit H [Ignicoccus islandicus DSM 13165]